MSHCNGVLVYLVLERDERAQLERRFNIPLTFTHALAHSLSRPVRLLRRLPHSFYLLGTLCMFLHVGNSCLFVFPLYG